MYLGNKFDKLVEIVHEAVDFEVHRGFVFLFMVIFIVLALTVNPVEEKF